MALPYRVEHREAGRIAVIARFNKTDHHQSTLDVYYSTLVHLGKRGLLVVVDEETGIVVASRQLPK